MAFSAPSEVVALERRKTAGAVKPQRSSLRPGIAPALILRAGADHVVSLPQADSSEQETKDMEAKFVSIGDDGLLLFKNQRAGGFASTSCQVLARSCDFDGMEGAHTSSPRVAGFFLRNLAVCTSTDRMWLWPVLVAVIVLHMGLVMSVVASVFMLALEQPWYICVPLCLFVYSYCTNPVKCMLTEFENYLRLRLGIRRIGGFVGHYFIRPVKVWRSRNKAGAKAASAFSSMFRSAKGSSDDSHSHVCSYER